MVGKTWRRIDGDGLAYWGRCLLTDVIFWPDAAADYVDLYDGRDTVSGRLLCRIEADVDETIHFGFGEGLAMDIGIYVDGIDADVDTTVAFIPL